MRVAVTGASPPSPPLINIYLLFQFFSSLPLPVCGGAPRQGDCVRTSVGADVICRDTGKNVTGAAVANVAYTEIDSSPLHTKRRLVDKLNRGRAERRDAAPVPGTLGSMPSVARSDCSVHTQRKRKKRRRGGERGAFLTKVPAVRNSAPNDKNLSLLVEKSFTHNFNFADY